MCMCMHVHVYVRVQGVGGCRVWGGVGVGGVCGVHLGRKFTFSTEKTFTPYCGILYYPQPPPPLHSDNPSLNSPCQGGGQHLSLT